MGYPDKNKPLLTFLMHEIYANMNSSKGKLNAIANHMAIKNNDLLKTEVLEVLSYVEQINLLMNYVDFKENPESIDNLLESEPIDINIVKSFQKPNQYFQNLMKGKRLKYRVRAEDNIPFIKGYPILRSIVNIMLDNAIKYSPNDSEIECLIDSERNELIITMINEGPFVEEDEINNIVKFGVRGRSALSSGKRGHGFGLDFLNEIVHKIHFGKLKLNSHFNFHLNNIKYGTFECKIILPIV
jgi:signal transduction histidine kinase